MEHSLKITLVNHTNQTTVVQASGNRDIVIGRSEEADVVIDSMEVSRKHAVMTPTDLGTRIIDLSVNGLYQDGQRIDSGQTVPYGQAIYIGGVSMTAQRSDAPSETAPEGTAYKQRILQRLIEHMDLGALSKSPDTVRPRVGAALERLVAAEKPPYQTDLSSLIAELTDEAIGLGPLEKLLAEEEISEVMVVDYQNVYVERRGKLEPTSLSFTSEDAVRTIIERIITPLGRRIDESSPMVDARLPDGSRVNAIIPPLALRGGAITIRKFAKNPLTTDKLIASGSMNRLIADFLSAAVRDKANIVISGGTGSGKTTLLNVLASAIPKDERIVTVEDAAELKLPQPHVVPLESKAPNSEGKGAVTIRDLIRNSLRMRPDRIVVGECRGGEALDMLQAMNTGHSGSLTTTHANSPNEAISRLETLSLMADVELPSRAIREQIAGAVDIIVQQSRFPNGQRRITSIAEVSGMEKDGRVRLVEIFRYDEQLDDFLATGWLSSYFTEEMLSTEAHAQERS